MNLILDFSLGILLTFFLNWYISKSPIFFNSPFSISSLQFAFILKILVSFILFFLYSYYYTNRSEADTFRYFDDSAILYNSLHNNPTDFFKMMSGIGIDNHYFDENYFSKMNNWYRSYENGLINDNRLVIRINALIRIFSFGSYHIHAVIFNFFAFIGAFELSRLFFKISKTKWKSYIAAFLIPSFVFWSSGVLKETLLIGLLGIWLNRAYLIWHNEISFKNSVLVLFGFFFLFVLKIYVLLAFSPVIIYWSINKIIRDWRFSLFLTFTAFAGILLITPLVFHQIDPLHILVQKQHDFINLAETFDAKSKIELFYMEESYLSFLNAAPIGFINSFFRPYPWDINSFLVLLPFLENLLLLVLLIFTCIYRNKLDKNQFEFILSSIIFIGGLYVVIGVSTPVIGAIVRYKIPGLPFVFICLLIILNQNKISKKINHLKFISWINSRL